jgi:preprotein translocase subunit YajC
MKKLTTFFIAIFSVFSMNVLFAEEAQVETAKQGNYMQTFVMIAVFLLIFYFVLMRPEQKRKKRMQAQRDSIKTGDRVTAMGIIGTVAEVKENTLVLKMIDGAKVEFLKAAITDVQSPMSQENAKA